MTSTHEILTRPFPPELIRHRPGRNGEDVTYIEGHVIIARLNEAFNGAWDLLIEKHEILDDEVLVLARLRAGGIEKMAFGGSAITRTRSDQRVVSLVDDVKAAEVDAVKRCARLLGVALTLHASTGDPAQQPAPSERPPSANGLLSAAQLRAIHAIRRKLGWTDDQLADFATRVTGCADVERMDKRAASTFIERLQAEAAPAGAAR